jgi:hypothetical protein
VMVLGGITMEGMETRGIGKSKWTSTMKIVGLSIVESYKVEGKLLVTSIIVRIKSNAHKEFPICAFKNILFSLSNLMGHKPKETLATTMFGHERLQALTYSYKRELLLP